MPGDQFVKLRDLVAQAECAVDETRRAAALAELQRAGASILREAVSCAREKGISWGTLAVELKIAASTLRDHFSSEHVRPLPVSRPKAKPAPARAPDQFVGRQRELTALRRKVRGGRTVTLKGPGGIGKTRLAAEFAHRCRAMFNQVWWVELGEADGVPDETVAAVLGGEPADVIARACRSGPALLVLDNCEHLIDDCARLVERLTDGQDGLAVLTTSRETLRVAGEQVLSLDPLPIDPAVTLFVDRARAVSDDFELTDDLAALTERLCEHLDRLPLAIELAARQAAVLPLAELVDRLDERLVLLNSACRTAPDRQQSLHAAIKWSYDLLPAVERAVFRRITIFPDTFERQDAAVVCGDLDLPEAQLWATLTSLVTKSLVVTAEDRFRVLESLRLFGNDELQRAREWQPAVERFLDRMAQFAAGARTSTVPPSVRYDKRALHWRNLEHAVTLVHPMDDERYACVIVALVGARQQHLLNHDNCATLQKALSRQRSPLGRTLLLTRLAVEVQYRGDNEASRRYSAEAVDAARRCDNTYALYAALFVLTEALARLHRHDAVDELLPELTACARALGDPSTLGKVLVLAAEVRVEQGRLGEAERTIEEALSIIDAENSNTVFCELANVAGMAALQRRNHEDAARHFDWVLSAGDPYAKQVALQGKIIIAARTGHPGLALRLSGTVTETNKVGADAGRPWWNDTWTAAVEQARSRLSPSAAEKLAGEGAKMTLEEAAASARCGASPSILTPRETEVAELVADRLTNRAIALRLGVSDRTVASHLESIRAKLDLPSKAHIKEWVWRSRPGA